MKLIQEPEAATEAKGKKSGKPRGRPRKNPVVLLVPVVILDECKEDEEASDSDPDA